MRAAKEIMGVGAYGFGLTSTVQFGSFGGLVWSFAVGFLVGSPIKVLVCRGLGRALGFQATGYKVQG